MWPVTVFEFDSLDPSRNLNGVSKTSITSKSESVTGAAAGTGLRLFFEGLHWTESHKQYC